MHLSQFKTIHFTGIKGVGMTALACMARDCGMTITGSDVEGSFVTDAVLAKKGISVMIGFEIERLDPKPDLVVYTAAHKAEENNEVVEAKRLGIPTLSFGEALGLFFNSKPNGISVCGVGGKTTTTAMLATILERAGRRPSYMVGVGHIPSLPFPGQYQPAGDIFVSEADEYACSPKNQKPKFKYQNPKVIILTNLAYDHPDIYPNEAATLATFRAFIQTLPADGLLIANQDSDMVRQLLPELTVSVLTYGFDPTSNWQIVNYQVQDQEAIFELKSKQESTKTLRVNVPGRFNAANAVAAWLAAQHLGLDDETIQRGLDKFLGTGRRFEKVAEIGTTLLYDDYAHHPDEIQSTLTAVREWFPEKKIVVIFQPHTYSRTKALFQEFAASFSHADTVIIADIFASAREPYDNTIDSEMLVQAIRKWKLENGNEGLGNDQLSMINYQTNLKLKINNKKFRDGREIEEPKNNETMKQWSNELVFYCPGEREVVEQLRQLDLENTVIFTMGAGDIYQWKDSIVQLLNG